MIHAHQVAWLVMITLATGCGGADRSPETAPTPDVPSGVIDSASDYLAIAPGGSVYFTSKVYCPVDAAPCTYLWDFGDGKTSTKQDPGAHVFSTLGFYKVTLQVTDAKGKKDPTPSAVYVTVWTGTFSDKFNRAKVDYDKHGWRRPLRVIDKPMYDIQKGWLHVTGDEGMPGSTGILAWPQVQDFHLEVTKRRQANPKVEHYSDILLRMHPSGGVGQFYRVRIWEEGSKDAGIEIAIFKITSPDDEHGYLLNDPSQPQKTKPTVCKACPFYGPYPWNKDLRIIVDAQGATIRARIEDPKVPGKVILSTKTTDTLGTPYVYKGLVGLTHFEGVSYFDDFTFKAVKSGP